jgi:hypothetical protein
MKDEALKLALEALTFLLDEWTPARQAQLKGMEAITAIKQALAAPVQEPVGEVVVESMGVRGADAMRVRMHFYKEIPPVGSKIYTTPPAAQRQWTGLTDEEIIQCTPNWIGTLEDVARAIEAKLKEKNT